MNINLQNFLNDNLQYNVKGDSQNIQNTTNGTDVVGNTNGVNLKDLLIGDIFSGKIMDITNYNVDILLDNNQHINAVMQQALELNIGDKLLFQVKDKNDNQIFIRPVANNQVSMELVSKSLMAAGLGETDRNIAIVKELIGKEQPIDRQSILNIIKLTARYGNENIDKIIDMTKNGIEVNDNNLKMYDVYMQSKHQIASEISDIQNNIIKYLTDIPEDVLNGSPDSAHKIINNKVNDMIDFINKLSVVFDNQDNEIDKTIIKEDINLNNGDKTVINNNEHAVNTDSNISDNVNNNIGKENDVNKNYSDKVIHEILSENNDEKNADKRADGNIQNVSESEYKINLKDNPFEKAESLKDIGNILKQMSESGMDKGEVIKHIHSDRLSHKLTEIFEKQLYLNPDKLSEEKGKIKEQVDKIYEKLDRLSEIIKENVQPLKNNGLTDSAAELKNNMNFMNELNNIESYVQLPVKFSEGKGNGDLYVYNKKRGRQNKDDVLTAFLHLDMKYLGATDVSITMEKKNVITKFTLSDDISIKIVNEHIDEVIKKIEKLGYIVKMSVEEMENKINETVNPLQPITKNNDKAVAVKRYTLDIRT